MKFKTPKLPSNARIHQVRDFIRRSWDSTVVHPSKQKEGEIPLPLPGTVPGVEGTLFRTVFYWDTYFINEGLLLDGDLRQARNNAENFMHVVETQGFIPNSMRRGMSRSQPALASWTYRVVYEKSQDKAWLQRALRATEREYAFWNVMRRGADGLFSARPYCPPQEVWNFYWSLRDRVGGMPGDPVEQFEFLFHGMANAEAGSDFSPRFEKRAADFYALIIDVPVYTMETNAAWFCSELGDETGRARWQARADEHLARFQQLMWHEKRGLFIDYDYKNRCHAKIAGAETFMPLWAGMATPEQARRVHDSLSIFEKDFGVTTCEPGPRDQVYQWDDPNAWPPMQEFAFVGLHRYGFEEAARRIAAKYVTATVQNFEKTGQLWEKYNAYTGGTDVADEYKMPPILDWTAGVFNVACDLLGGAAPG